MTSKDERSNRVFLAAVLLSGAASMAMVVQRDDSEGATLPEDVVATINGAPISRAAFDRAREAVRADRRRDERPGDEQHVLDRLIDEELLVQYAVRTGLHRSEPRSRAALVAAALAVVSAEAEADDPDDATLAEFYDTHQARFAAEPRVRLERRFFAGSGPEGETLAALVGAPPEAEAPAPLPLPGGPLMRRQVVSGLGGSAATAVFSALEDGGEVPSDWLGPFPHDGGRSILRVVGRVGGAAPALSEVRARVLAYYRRTAGERAVRRVLDLEREEGDIVLSVSADDNPSSTPP